MRGGFEKVRILLITVAGMSTRFSKSLGKDVLKCIYYKNDISESLLFRMLHQPVKFDKYIIVGGYKFNDLKQELCTKFTEFSEKIILVKNNFYSVYGSGYSLYCGLEEALKYEFDELVFAEGDLFVDSDTFKLVCNSAYSVITCNSEPVLAKTAVAFYFNERNRIHYIYDTGHSSLMITEPFVSIYNSGQIWKFANLQLLNKVYNSIDHEDWRGTNLTCIEKYFRQLTDKQYQIIKFQKWINCNTIEDFEQI